MSVCGFCLSCKTVSFAWRLSAEMLQNRGVNRVDRLKRHENSRSRPPAKPIRHMSRQAGKSDDWSENDSRETNGNRIWAIDGGRLRRDATGSEARPTGDCRLYHPGAGFGEWMPL